MLVVPPHIQNEMGTTRDRANCTLSYTVFVQCHLGMCDKVGRSNPRRSSRRMVTNKRICSVSGMWKNINVYLGGEVVE